jgi:hypothetical protein
VRPVEQVLLLLSLGGRIPGHDIEDVRLSNIKIIVLLPKVYHVPYIEYLFSRYVPKFGF